MFLHLRELQGLVSEGRGVIAHQVQRNQQLLSANAATLTRNLEDLEAQAKVCIHHNAVLTFYAHKAYSMLMNGLNFCNFFVLLNF